MRDAIARARERSKHASDATLDDLFVLDRCLDFLEAYALTWRLITQSKCSDSWYSLQDCFDLLRLIKRWSSIAVDSFESRLSQLESAYPYKIFFSKGLVVEYFECSICGQDMDAVICPHRRGHLYRGVIARAIARGEMQLDHISAVDHPHDKRCVPIFSDGAPGFSVVRKIGDLMRDRIMKVSQFHHLDFSTIQKSRSAAERPGRNEQCHCGSKKKYKRCCNGNDYVEKEHVEIVGGHQVSATEAYMV
ncbi:YecA family protein [Xanthomonas cannabis]|uniref:Zinc chelation protein SecC n=1 Tax=Xanthomonas cannabis TaxID=1885674 RepID=A0ABR6JLB5_9XANT|nr:SEC-C metal-binding domain-containing protein [Xanthomonas cannabis]MBB4593604.1 hypothetical protein [Xanthomonas cannabis]MBB5523259.1 hypothetical protein [Xanthomonas cannabis]